MTNAFLSWLFRGSLRAPLVAAALTLSSGPATASADEAPPVHALSLHVDTFDFAAKGFSVWLNYHRGPHRLFLTGGMNALPEFLNPQGRDFDERRDVFGQLGYVYHFWGSDGAFVGMEFLLQSMTITERATGATRPRLLPRFGAVVGYEWAPFSGGRHALLLIPWLSVRIPVVSHWTEFDSGSVYRVQEANFVAGFSVGYRFGL